MVFWLRSKTLTFFLYVELKLPFRHEIFHTLLFRNVLGVRHSHTVLLCSFFPFCESFLSLPSQHLRCCLRNPVLYHRPSNCVCLHTHLYFREYTACSNQNSCFSWNGFRAWMVSILCGTTILRCARCHGGTSRQRRRSVLHITSARNRNGSRATQYSVTEDPKRHSIIESHVPSTSHVVLSPVSSL